MSQSVRSLSGRTRARTSNLRTSTCSAAGAPDEGKAGAPADIVADVQEQSQDVDEESGDSEYEVVLAMQQQQFSEDDTPYDHLWTAGGGDSDDGDDDDDESDETDISDMLQAGQGSVSAPLSSDVGGSAHGEDDPREADPVHDTANAERVKAEWHARMTPPPSEAAIAQMLSEVQAERKALLSFAPAAVDAAGAASAMVYKLLLAELLADSAAVNAGGNGGQGGGGGGGLGGRWIDRDTLMQLKGTAALAQHPQYLRHTTHLPRVSRGVRLVVPTSTHSMQEALAMAVAHATGANLLALDDRVLKKVRRSALAAAVSAEGGAQGGAGAAAAASLSAGRMVSLLSEAAAEAERPLVVFLRDCGSELLRSSGACRALARELSNAHSRVLFLLSTVGDGRTSDKSRARPSAWTGDAPAFSQDSSQPEAPDLAKLFQGRQEEQGEGGSGMPPPQIMQRLMQEAIAKMQQQGQSGEGGAPMGPPPPELLESMTEALNSEDGKKLLEDFQKGASTISFTFIRQPLTPEQQQQQQQQQQGSAGAEGGLPAWLSNLRKTMSNRENPSMSGPGASRMGPTSPVWGRGPRPARNPGAPTSSQSDAQRLVAMFDDLTISPPPDAALRQHWDRWVEADVARDNTKHNRQALSLALTRNHLACAELSAHHEQLDSLLGRHRLTHEETDAVVLAALKMEVARAAAANAHSSSAQEGLMETNAQERALLSWRSVEAAFASVCKAHVPRPGQPMARTREEVAALAQADRHESALMANVILPKDIGVTYSMIGGLKEAKELLRQSITYPLKFPHLYSEGIAREAVKGVLLFGPPGTGKTMLAKAVATEGGATFLSVDASVIENKWLGESEKNARAVFTLARRLAPCVIYLDEVDSVLSSRERYDDTTHGTLTSVKTTIMQEWDGLRTTGDRVVVIASTNRPFDLDEAVLRRLPRRIMVDLPDIETREEILRVTMAGNRVDPSVDFRAIAETLEGFTGSDIKEVCREAVVRIAHEKAQELETGAALSDMDLTSQLRCVTAEDFQEARKRLTTSVSEKGRELARVWEWNDEYGELKKKGSETPRHNLAMYL